MKHTNVLCLLLIAIIGGTLISLSFINPYEREITLSTLILQLSGSKADLPLDVGLPELLNLSIKMIPEIVASIVIGIKLYSNFCTASVYIFSRYTNRIYWFISLVSKMMLTSLLFHVVLVISVIIMTEIRYNIIFCISGLFIALYHILVHSLWQYSMALLISGVAIYVGSDKSTVNIIGMQFLLITLLSLKKYSKCTILYRYNPMSSLILGWHISIIQIINESIRYEENSISFTFSFTYLACLTILITIITGIRIINYDLICSDVEIGGL